MKKNKNKIDKTIYLILFISLSLTLLTYIETNKIILSIVMILFSLSYIAFYQKRDNKSINLKKELINFLEQFIIESSLNTNYRTGFKEAVNNIPLSKLKDDLTDYLG